MFLLLKLMKSGTIFSVMNICSKLLCGQTLSHLLCVCLTYLLIDLFSLFRFLLAGMFLQCGIDFEHLSYTIHYSNIKIDGTYSEFHALID